MATSSSAPPASVTRDAVKLALGSLGMKTEDLREVVFEPKVITARYRRRNADGELVVADNSIAEVTYEIGVI